MATLEKIRNKSGLLVAVIGIALLSFVIGDLFSSKNSALFSDRTTAVKVGDDQIDIMEFQNRYEERSYQIQQQGQQVDGALIQNQVINEMIQESLINSEIEKNGIYVTSKELTEYMTGSMATQGIMQFTQQMGMQSPAELYDLIFNPMNYGMTDEQVAPYRQEWLKQEAATEQQLKNAKYASLLIGAIQANDLDKAAVYNDATNTPIVSIAKKSYSSLSNSDYTVSEAELKAEYEKEKYKYKVPKKFSNIRYITVDIKPSTEDITEATKIMEEAYILVKDEENIDAIRNNSELTVAERIITATDIKDANITKFITSAKVGDTTEPTLSANVYSMTKLIDKMVLTDSVMANEVIVQGDKNLQDSIMNLLNAGTSIEDIKTIDGIANTQSGIWIPITQLLNSNNQEIADKFINADKKYFVANSSDQVAYLYQITKKNAPKQMYKTAVATYKIYPSQATIDGLRNNMQEFINTNNTADKFTAEAAKAGYNALSAKVTAEDAQIANIPSTRNIIKWIHAAPKGSVSPLFDEEGNEKIIAVAVEDIYNEGFLPLTDVTINDMLTAKIRNDKKAADLISKYAGKATTVTEYAELMDTKADSAVGVNFSQMFIPLVGMNEPVLQGAIAAADINKVSGPIKGNTAIYVYEVTAVDNSGRQFNDDEAATQYSSTLGSQATLRNVVEILKANTTIENNMVNF